MGSCRQTKPTMNEVEGKRIARCVIGCSGNVTKQNLASKSKLPPRAQPAGGEELAHGAITHWHTEYTSNS